MEYFRKLKKKKIKIKFYFFFQAVKFMETQIVNLFLQKKTMLETYLLLGHVLVTMSQKDLGKR